jgi:hypothetical protein
MKNKNDIKKIIKIAGEIILTSAYQMSVCYQWNGQFSISDTCAAAIGAILAVGNPSPRQNVLKALWPREWESILGKYSPL